jgi:hypothetical protein
MLPVKLDSTTREVHRTHRHAEEVFVGGCYWLVVSASRSLKRYTEEVFEGGYFWLVVTSSKILFSPLQPRYTFSEIMQEKPYISSIRRFPAFLIRDCSDTV